MSKLNLKSLFKQHAFSKLGAIKQTFGGATTWVTMAIFLFSGIAAWNTPTMDVVRDYLPWLTLPIFASVIILGIAFMMWLEHFVVQSSLVLYWAKMFWDKGNPLRRYMEGMGRKLDRTDKKLDELAKAVEALAEKMDKEKVAK